MGSYFAVDYDRAIGSCTILLTTFGYFHNLPHTLGDRRLVAIDFGVIGAPAPERFIEQISTQPLKNLALTDSQQSIINLPNNQHFHSTNRARRSEGSRIAET